MMLDVLSATLLGAGALFCLVGGIGLLRMPDVFTRMHAASVLDTLGAGCLIAGLMVLAGWTLVSVKLLAVALLIFFASPAVSHALAKAGRERDLRPMLTEGAELWKH